MIEILTIDEVKRSPHKKTFSNKFLNIFLRPSIGPILEDRDIYRPKDLSPGFLAFTNVFLISVFAQIALKGT